MYYHINLEGYVYQILKLETMKMGLSLVTGHLGHNVQ